MEVKLDWGVERFFDGIVERATAIIVEKLEDAISREVQKRVSGTIDAQLNDIIKGVLEAQFRPVNSFGEPTGEPTTVKAIITQKAESFLSEIVDGQGKKADHYSSTKQPRAQWLIGAMYAEAFNAQAKADIKVIAESAKAKAHKAVAELLVAQLTK